MRCAKDSILAYAFQVAAGLKPTLAAARSSAPVAMTPVDVIPATMMLAEDAGAVDGSTFVAVSGLLGGLFIFLVVGTVVTNFGIMRK